MSSMTRTAGPVTGGVDTHGDTHHAAVIDQVGRHLNDQEFGTDPAGYRQLLRWLRGQGALQRVGIEGTGSYGAGLARYLHREGVTLVEVDRPDRRARRTRGKSDPIDAYHAARAALNESATGTPKTRDGLVEAIRQLRVARSSAVKIRTQTMNSLKALIVTAPEDLRETLRALSPAALITACTRLRPAATGTALSTTADPVTTATKIALRSLARRHAQLSQEITDLNTDLAPLIQQTAAPLLALPGIGPEVAGQLLSTAGDNPTRLRSEAAFAHLCGVAPLPASSGQRNRHRLNRSGDRQANAALYTIVLTRLRYDERTQAYATRRTTEGLSKKEIIRCLKRHIAREVYRALITTITPPPAQHNHPPQPLDNP